MGTTELFALVVLVVIVAIWFGRRSGANDAEATQWADARGVELTADTTLVVERYLLWSRRGRRIGALIGFVSPWIYSGISGRAFDEGSWALALMLLGYLFGALAAEVVVDRARTTETTALMHPRRLVDYLPANLLKVQRALGVLALAMIVPYALFQPDATIDLPGVGTIASYAVGGALIAVIVEMIERRIVARRQSLADVSDVEVDDALRSTSIHMVAGAGLALLIQFAGPLVAVTLAAAIPGEAGGIVAGVVLVAEFLLSFSCWMHIAHPTRYRVQRGLRSAA
jgi:multisubunit Na+/H+ antiporter MnhE subunit